MNRLSHPRLERAFAFVPLTLIGAGLLLTLSGCPGGADLEDPAKYGIAGAPSTGTGGTTSTGGTTGGSAGGSTSATLTVNCTGTTYQTALQSCNTIGCHAASFPAANLNLVADASLVSRVKDVPSTHTNISCTGPTDTTCTCDSDYYCSPPPSSCPSGALLVDSSNYMNSWILKKIDLTDPMCGIAMPNGAYKSPADKACIEAMVQAIAMLPK